MTTPFLISYVALWVLVLAQFLAIFALFHHFAQTYLTSREGRANQGPAVGSKLKPVPIEDVEGNPWLVPAVGQPTLVVFASTTCKLCAKLKADLANFVGEHRNIRPIVLCAGSQKEVRRWASTLAGLMPVVQDRKYKLAASLGIGMTPFLVGVDGHGTVRVKGLVNDSTGLEWAVEEMMLPVIPQVTVAESKA